MTATELKLECAKILYPICSKLDIESDRVIDKVEKLYQYIVLPDSSVKEHSEKTPKQTKRGTS